MAPDDDGRRRLGEAVRAARVRLEMSQAAAATRGGVSALTWGAVERGQRHPTELTLLALDRGLGWPPGTAGRIYTSETTRRPRPKAATTTTAPVDLGTRLDRIETTLGEILAILRLGKAI